MSLLSTAMHVGSMGHAIVSSADTASVPHSVPRLPDRAVLPRWTERAPRRALRRRQRPSSALQRRWRSSARRPTSRCSSCCLCGSAAVAHRPGLLLQSVHAPDSDCDGCTYYADVAAFRSGPQPVTNQSRLPNVFHALLIEQDFQVDQARAEARAAEAAIEEQLAAALALERAEFDKQARSWPCVCSNRDVRCVCPSLLCTVCAADCVEPLCMPYLAARGLVGR